MKDLLIEIDRLADEYGTAFNSHIPQAEMIVIMREYGLLKESVDYAGAKLDDLQKDMEADNPDMIYEKGKAELLRAHFAMMASQAIEMVGRMDNLKKC